MEDELREEEGAVPRYLHKLWCPPTDTYSYLEGVTAPEGPILDKPEGVKDSKLSETAS